jgi:hypothetical protein
MKNPFPAWVWWILAAAIMFACGVTLAQPATQPVAAPQIQQIRDLAEWAADLDRQQRDTAERLAQAQIEIGRLESAAELYVQGKVLEAGHVYRLPDGEATAINVTVPDVTLIGGLVWPIPDGPNPAIAARSENLRVIGVRFSWDAGPAERGKLPLRPCVRSYGKNTRVIGCTFGRVNEAISCMAPCDGVLVQGCHGGLDVRSAFIYVGGGKNVTIVNNVALDSQVENLIRFSPELGVVPDTALVAFNDFTNLDSKAAIELRSVNNVIVWKNRVRAANGHTCISVGRSSLAEGPGTTNARILENECYGGRIEIDAGAADVEVVGNKQWGLRFGTDPAQRDKYDVPIVANGGPGTLKNLRMRNNVAWLPRGGATIKPYFGGTANTTIPGLDFDASNGWRIEQ